MYVCGDESVRLGWQLKLDEDMRRPRTRHEALRSVVETGWLVAMAPGELRSTRVPNQQHPGVCYDYCSEIFFWKQAGVGAIYV